MNDEFKITYEQIEKANEEIIKMSIGKSKYAKVSERVKAFRKVCPNGCILTEIEKMEDDYVQIKATIKNYDNIISTARASEEKQSKGKMGVNLTNMIENCETSAVGRALGFAGLGIDSDIASSEDIEKNKYQNKTFEITENMHIREDDAKKVIKSSIGDLMRKMGVVKESLSLKVKEQLWTTLEELNVTQLLNLESKLKTLNMESNDWHNLYNENTKIKDVVPKNQEVVYESSWYKFGKIALEKAGDDELLKNKIIDSYLDMGINLQ